MKYKKSYYHNEIELVKVNETELKNKIEQIFLRNRISYFIRWDRPSVIARLFGKKDSNYCKICINEWDKEKALELIREMKEISSGQGEILLRPTESILPDVYVHKHR